LGGSGGNSQAEDDSQSLSRVTADFDAWPLFIGKSRATMAETTTSQDSAFASCPTPADPRQQRVPDSSTRGEPIEQQRGAADAREHQKVVAYQRWLADNSDSDDYDDEGGLY
jgi:hypothetical protein